MRRKFTGQCFECGGWGHKATDHQNNWIEQPEPVGQSEDGHSATSEQPGRLEIYRFPRDRQSQPPPQEHAIHRSFDRMQKGTGGGVHYGFAYNATEATLPGFTEDFKKRTGAKDPVMFVMSAEAALEIENRLANATDEAQARKMLWDSLAAMEFVDIDQLIDARDRGDISTPIRPQGRPSYGILPSTRAAAVPALRGTSLPANNHRVQKPGTVRGHGQKPRQMTLRDARRDRAWIRQDEGDTGEMLKDNGYKTVRGQPNVGRQGVGQSGMTGGPGERYDHDAQASHPDAAGDPPLGNGSSGADRRQRNRPLHWQDPEYEFGPGQVVGRNLSISDARALFDRFSRDQPKGTRYNMVLIRMPPEDSAVSGPVNNGFEK